jgi:hypothetical protein
MQQHVQIAAHLAPYRARSQHATSLAHSRQHNMPPCSPLCHNPIIYQSYRASPHRTGLRPRRSTVVVALHGVCLATPPALVPGGVYVRKRSRRDVGGRPTAVYYHCKDGGGGRGVGAYGKKNT